MNNRQTVLFVGLLLIGLCALFPPMKYAGGTYSVDNSTTAAPGFLFNLNLYEQGDNIVALDIDRLLAEWVLIGAVTGMILIRIEPEAALPDA